MFCEKRLGGITFFVFQGLEKIPGFVHAFTVRQSDSSIKDAHQSGPVAKKEEALLEVLRIQAGQLVLMQASDDLGDLIATQFAELGRVESGGSLKASATDLFRPLREAVYSVDAKEWRPAVAADGLIDGRSETFLLKIEDDARLLLLRLTDAHFNVITHDLTSYLP